VGVASSLMSSVGNLAGSLTNVSAENSGGARQRKTGGPKIREIIEEEDLDNDSFEELPSEVSESTNEDSEDLSHHDSDLEIVGDSNITTRSRSRKVK